MSRIALIIAGILFLIMGVLGAIPSIGIGTEPIWHAIVKIVVGIVAIVIGIIDKKK